MQRRVRDSENEVSRTGYYGIMEYGAFGLTRTDFDAPVGSTTWTVWPYAFGNVSGTRPDENLGGSLGTATWNGVMVGFDTDRGARNTPFANTIIQGDATISVKDLDFLPDVNVEFTNIRNLSTGKGVRDMRWNDIYLRPDGSFKDSILNDDDYVEGAFFGSAHEEVGGVFKKNLYAGSFGAKR